MGPPNAHWIMQIAVESACSHVFTGPQKARDRFEFIFARVWRVRNKLLIRARLSQDRLFFFSYVFLHCLRSHELISFPVSFQLRPVHPSQPPRPFGGPTKWTAMRCEEQCRNSDSQKTQELQTRKRHRHEQMSFGEVKSISFIIV